MNLLHPIRWAKAAMASFRATDEDAVSYIAQASESYVAKGKAYSEDMSMRVSAAWACQRILTEAIGTLPWAVYRKDERGNAQPYEDHPLYSLFQFSPNAEQDPVQFRECIGLGLVQRGNRYFFKDRTGDRVTQLVPIWEDVEVLRKGPATHTKLNIAEGTVFFRVKSSTKAAEDYTRDDVWHVKGFGNNIAGLSPISAARDAITAGVAAEEFGARFFTQGGMPAGVVSIPNWLSKEHRVIARNNLQQLMGGFGAAHKFVLFEGGMKPEPWGQQDLEDMQFIAVRKFSINEICRFYRIPPHMVADLDKATFSNIEHLSQEFVTFTLMPYLTRIEAAFNRWLLAPAEWGKVFLRFNYEALLRADSAARAAFYNSALQNGYMSRNEVRAKENLNAVEGLDDYTVQVNMTNVDQLGKPTTVASPFPPPTTNDKQSTISVILPQSMRYEVEASGMKHALNEFSIAAEAIADRMDASQRALVNTVAKGNTAIADEIAKGNEAIVSQLDEHHSTLAAQIVSANEVVMDGHSALNKSLRARRRIRVGEDTYESEVIDEPANPLGGHTQRAA